jgi:hypothetical protein
MSESGPNELNKEFTGSIVSGFIYLPATAILTLPFALLPWGVAHISWAILTGGLFLLATFLMWDLAASYSPIVAGALLGLLLTGSVLILEVGNAAGIVISCCAIALWCFHRNRLAVIGIICLSIGLMVKPHDAAAVWLCLFLAGRPFRKRSLQSLLVALILGLPPTLWVEHIAPNWIHELRTTLSTMSSRGGVLDPGPVVVDPRAHGAMPVNLQTAISVLKDDQHFYNLVTYCICGPLILTWIVASFVPNRARTNQWLGLAAICALSMLPIYHRQHDARLLMVTVPAAAILWTDPRPRRWMAVLLSGGTIFLTGDLPSQILAVQTHWLVVSSPPTLGKIFLLLFDRPAPLLLLAMGSFYLWAYSFPKASSNFNHHADNPS